MPYGLSDDLAEQRERIKLLERIIFKLTNTIQEGNQVIHPILPPDQTPEEFETIKEIRSRLVDEV